MRGRVLILLGATLVLAACGGENEEGAEQPTDAAVVTGTVPTEQTTTPVAAGVLGEWESDLPESVQQYDGGTLPPAGPYRIEVGEDTLTFSLPGAHRFPSHDVVDVSDAQAETGTMTITWADAPAEEGCFEGHLGDRGEYEWSIEDGSLRFRAVEDACADRRLILTSSRWTRPE